MNNSNTTTTKSKSLGRIGKACAFGLALSGSMMVFGGTAGAASGEAELGTALSASMSVGADGVAMIQITEVDLYGNTRTITVPADSIIRISGIAQARQSVNLAAMYATDTPWREPSNNG